MRTWHAELQAAHARTCTGPDGCSGVPALTDILAADPWDRQLARGRCNQAVEAQLLLHGVYYGFRVLPEGRSPDSVAPYEVRNYPMTAACAAAISATIADDEQRGLLIRVDEKPRHLTALAAKEEQNGAKVRQICDYRQPEGASINNHVEAHSFALTGHEAIQAMLRAGDHMWKVDVKSAFRTVGVHTDHWCLLAYNWPDARGRDRYYHDTRFPFGLACSPEIFCRLSTAVRQMLATRDVTRAVVYVDDFIGAEAHEELAEHAKQTLCALLGALGFSVSPTKVEGPDRAIVALGLLYETAAGAASDQLRVSVPQHKMRTAMRHATAMLRQRTITPKQLERAIGYFQHICGAIGAAKAYLGRLIQALRDANERGRTRIALTRSVQLDLQFWERVARHHNGVALLPANPDLVHGFLSTDAAGGVGMGLFFNGDGRAIRWSDLRTQRLPAATRGYNKAKLWPTDAEPSRASINYKEMYTIFYALLLWAPQFANKHVTLHCDNDAARQNVNKLRATRSPGMMALARRTARLLVAFNIRLRVVRIDTHANILADALSRGQMQLYSELLPDWQRFAAANPAWGPAKFPDPPLFEGRAALITGAPPAAIADSDDDPA